MIGELLSLDGPPTTALEASRREICAEMAQGSWGKALNWMEPEAWDKRKILIDFLYDPKSQLNPLVEWSASAPKNMEKMIDQLEVFLMDLIRWSISQLPPQNYTQSNLWINSDAQTPLSAIATKGNSNLTASRNTWIERARRLAKARVELSAPLNRKLLAQDLLMSWLA